MTITRLDTKLRTEIASIKGRAEWLQSQVDDQSVPEQIDNIYHLIIRLCDAIQSISMGVK